MSGPRAAVAVLDDWQGVARGAADWSPLEARAALVFFAQAFASEDAAVAALARFDVLLTMRERMAFPRSLIERLPRLRMIGITGARVATLDMAACAERGITVAATGAPAEAAFATAELALGLLLAAARAIPRADASMRAGGFQAGVPVGISLAGKTLGVIGLGRLGQRFASYGQALGMRVLAWSPNLTPERAVAAGCTYATKDALLAQADAVSLHMVLSDRSRGVLGAADLARMRRGCILVNTSRGPLVDEAALVRAVADGRIVAALDVYDREPPGSDHPCGCAGTPCSRRISVTASPRPGRCSTRRASRMRARFSTGRRSAWCSRGRVDARRPRPHVT